MVATSGWQGCIQQLMVMDGGGERNFLVVPKRGEMMRKWEKKVVVGLLVVGRAANWREEEE